MDELTKYAADVIEFIAGGILFLTALLIWGYLWVPGTLDGHIFLFATTLGEVSSLALGIGLLGITYTLGVFAEGASRVATEWRLRRLTCEAMRSEFGATSDDDVAAAADSRLLEAGPFTYAWTLLQIRPCRDCLQKISARRRATSTQKPPAEQVAVLRTLCPQDGPKIRERVRQRRLQGRLEEKREEWRSIAYRSASGAKAIDAQLKRLRIERTLLFSIALMTLALASKAVQLTWFADPPEGIDPHALWGLSVAGLVLAMVSWHLVNERFGRFLGTIVRNYRLEVLAT